jgi:uncharacterized protein (TIGR02001 family)
MKKTILAAAVLSAMGAASNAMAQASAPASPHTVTGNVGVFSDYRFRGISQTFKAPAVQGGFDYAHASGFYAGNWNSNVSGLSYANGASLEMDFYAGYKTDVAGVGLDVGTLYYYYPKAEYTGTDEKYDNHEIYLGASFGPVSAKLSYALTDYFGLNSTTSGSTLGDSNGTIYAELNFSQEVAPKTTLTAHVGHTNYKNYSDLDYTDYKLGVGYDVNGYVFGLAYVGNSVKDNGKGFYSVTNANGKKEDLYKGGAVVSLSKSF